MRYKLLSCGHLSVPSSAEEKYERSRLAGSTHSGRGVDERLARCVPSTFHLSQIPIRRVGSRAGVAACGPATGTRA